MAKVMAEDFGNPSSTHSFGRNAKSVLELSRKSIAKRLNASAQEIILRLVERKPTTGYFVLLWQI
jgi:cysteine desulfurase